MLAFEDKLGRTYVMFCWTTGLISLDACIVQPGSSSIMKKNTLPEEEVETRLNSSFHNTTLE